MVLVTQILFYFYVSTAMTSLETRPARKQVSRDTDFFIFFFNFQFLAGSHVHCITSISFFPLFPT